MQAKSEAPRKIQQFAASFNAYASVGKSQPVRIVGALKTDNAGEFTSRLFQEFLLTPKLLSKPRALRTCIR